MFWFEVALWGIGLIGAIGVCWTSWTVIRKGRPKVIYRARISVDQTKIAETPARYGAGVTDLESETTEPQKN